MLPNMKFYVVSIVAIFTALGLGIYIGFSMDTEGFITDQQENLVSIVETQFKTIRKENEDLALENEELNKKSKNREKYIDESYEILIKDQLEGLNISLIETSDSYVNSSIGYDLEKAGANVVNLTSLERVESNKLKELVTNIVNGENGTIFKELKDMGAIKTLGNYSIKPDYIIVCGGSKTTDNKVALVDKLVIDTAKNLGVDVVGVEKSYVGNSYASKYKEYGITTVDNIDMKIGKVATVLSLNSKGGNFGIKGTAESVLPLK